MWSTYLDEPRGYRARPRAEPPRPSMVCVRQCCGPYRKPDLSLSFSSSTRWTPRRECPKCLSPVSFNLVLLARLLAEAPSRPRLPQPNTCSLSRILSSPLLRPSWSRPHCALVAASPPLSTMNPAACPSPSTTSPKNSPQGCLMRETLGAGKTQGWGPKA